MCESRAAVLDRQRQLRDAALGVEGFLSGPTPFPLLHVDTTWKFQAMYLFRDATAKKLGLDLIVFVNRDGLAPGINPFTHGSQIHTDVMKTQALKLALDAHGFDAAIGGARRDEEKSRAKERVFSFRSAQHHWDPKNQRPELWSLYNARKHKESIRVFPLSNWTELDVWEYIHLEKIPIVPLYFAAERPVVERDGALIMVDDHRMPLTPGEKPRLPTVRFRTLGCYPLTGAIEREATTVPAIIAELLSARLSERQGRVIDHDAEGSMEQKNRTGTSEARRRRRDPDEAFDTDMCWRRRDDVRRLASAPDPAPLHDLRLGRIQASTLKRACCR